MFKAGLLVLLLLNLSLVLCSILCNPQKCSAASAQVVGLNNEGVKALTAGNFQLAIRKFEEALKLEPSYGLAKENLAITYNNYGLQLQNSPREAIKLFHKSLALNPNSATTLNNLEGIIQLLGKNPKSFKDRVELGRQARLAGEFEGAIVEFSQALKLKDDAKLHSDLGDVYRVRDQIDNAIAEFTAAARSVTDQAELASIYVKLGQSYQAKQDLPKAIAAYGDALKYKSDDRDVLDALKTGWEDALRKNPVAPENHIGLGQAYQYAGDFSQAEAEYKQALNFDRNNQIALKLLKALPEAKKQAETAKHINIGVDLQTRKLYDAAIAEYKAALAADNQNASVWVNIGTAYQSKEDFHSAIAAYNKALTIEPGNKAAQQGLRAANEAKEAKLLADATASGASLFKLGKFDEALTKYEQVLKAHPQDAATHFNIAATLQALKRLDEAIAEYNQAIRLDSKNQDYHRALDAALNAKAEPIMAQAIKKHQGKDYPAAIDLYQQAISLRPKNIGLLYNLASAYYSRQQYLEAKKAYEKALELDPRGQADNLWFIGTIEENSGNGYEAISNYRKYLATAPGGKYAQAVKTRLEALTKNPKDVVKIKSEQELAQIQEATDAYQAAVKLQQAQKYEEAISLYQKAINIQPQEASYAYALGTLFQQKGDIDLAINWYQTAINLDKTSPAASATKEYQKSLQTAFEQKATPLVEQAVKKQTAGDLKAAIDLYQQALSILPNNARLYTNLGSAYQVADDFAKAQEAYKKGLDIDPKGEAANWYFVAAIDEHFGKGFQALEAYQKYINSNRSGQFVTQASERVKALRVNISQTQKLHTQAEINSVKEAAEAYETGLKLQEASKFDEAISLYQKSAKLMPAEPIYVFALATAYQAKSDYDLAISYYQKALALDPKNKDYLRYLNAVLDLKAGPLADEALKKHQLGDYIGAVELYRKALAINSKNARMHTNAAAALQAADDLAAARIEYQTAYDLDAKGEVENLYFLGALAEHFGQGSSALAKYKDYLFQAPKGQFAKYAQERLNALSTSITNTQKIPSQAEIKNAKRVQELFDQAVKSQQEGKYDEAIKLYQEATKLVPTEAAYAYALGTAYQASGNVDEAIKSYAQAVQLDRNNKEYKKVLEQANEFKASPLIDEAVKKQAANDFAGAIALYRQALTIIPKNAKLHTNLAIALQSNDDFSLAKEEFQRAVGLDPKGELDNWYFIAALEEHAGKGPQAIQAYNRYLQLAPRGTYAALAQSRLKELASNPSKTVKLVTAKQQKQSSEANDLYQAAVKLQEEHKLEEAIAKYQEALRRTPEVDAIWYGLGTAYQAKGDFDQALVNYTKASALNPKELSYRQLIKQLNQSKTGPLLESAYKKQTTKNEQGNTDLAGAIADYEAALKIDDDSTTHLNLGTAYQANKNYLKALEEYRKALVLDPKLYDAYYYIGTIYETMGQPRLATAEYRKYLQFQAAGQYSAEIKSRLKALTGR